MEFSKDNKILVVRVSAADLRDPVGMHQALERKIVGEEQKRILVELVDVDLPSSLQIGCLVSLHVLAYENVAILKFTGLSEKVRSLFRMLGVETLIEMHYGREEALRSFDEA